MEVVVVAGNNAAVAVVFVAVFAKEQGLVGLGQEVVRSEGRVVQIQMLQAVESHLQLAELSA